MVASPNFSTIQPHGKSRLHLNISIQERAQLYAPNIIIIFPRSYVTFLKSKPQPNLPQIMPSS